MISIIDGDVKPTLCWKCHRKISGASFNVLYTSTLLVPLNVINLSGNFSLYNKLMFKLT